MATVHTKIEHERGCGYRKEGGLYLVCDGPSRDCGRLPIPLTVCSCCGEGIKQSRGFTWVLSALFMQHKCRHNDFAECFIGCPLGTDTGGTRYGLMWVGEKFYPTPTHFIREGRAMGISKRIARMPRDFVVGETWILLAHRKAVGPFFPDSPLVPEYSPGIFQAFKPSRIEYVVKGTESEDELNSMEKRGFTLVKVVRDVDAQQTIFDNENKNND